MSISEKAREKRLRAQSAKDLKTAKAKARRAVDLKDPRFLGEAAVAASRGPVGLALFAAGKGVQAGRDRAQSGAQAGRERAAAGMQSGRERATAAVATSRREPAEYVKGNSGASKEGRAAAKRELKRLAKSERGPLRRFAPLWGTALVGGLAVAGGTAFFLRGPSSKSKPSSSSRPASPAPRTTTGNADTAAGHGTTVNRTQATAATGAAATVHTSDPDGSSAQADSAAATGGGRHELREQTSTSPVDRYAAEGVAAATPDDPAAQAASGHTPTTAASTGGLAAGGKDETNDPGHPKRA